MGWGFEPGGNCHSCCEKGINLCIHPGICTGNDISSSGLLVNLLTSPVGSVTGTCITNASGCCSFSLPTGTYYTEVFWEGNEVVHKNITYQSNASVATTMVIPSGYICCDGYLIPMNLTLTDSEGSMQFVYYPNGDHPEWFGGHTVQRGSRPVTTPNNVCVVGQESVGPVKICYQMVCFAGSSPHFSVQRSWSWVYGPTDPVTGPGPPIYYQDPSNITAGLPCVTSPPAICGSPLTDTAGFTADPESDSPFLLKGNPVSAGANYTIDPIGSSVTISA